MSGRQVGRRYCRWGLSCPGFRTVARTLARYYPHSSYPYNADLTQALD